MGKILKMEPHVKRSSSMSFALRWKHENARLIALVALMSVAITFMFLVLLHGMALKKVFLIVDGEQTEVTTNQWSLRHLLDEQGISVGKHDRISASLDDRLTNGTTIAIDHAVPVQVNADGMSSVLYTTGRTVSDAIEQLRLSLGEEDKVVPALETELKEYGAIRIIRVQRLMEENEESIPFQTITKQDANLTKGKEKTIQQGVQGKIVKKVEKVYEDGRLVSTKEIGEFLRAESVDKVVAVGTKSPVVILTASSPSVEQVTMKGVTFGAKQILKNVTLTAYSAGVKSTGKTEDHPHYGLTFSGTRVTEGRTVSVDPKVIPIGWWIYIEGIGFRRAEDIGSAVKGKKIDVFYENEDYATRFGTKRGYTVYIIGPRKPEAQ